MKSIYAAYLQYVACFLTWQEDKTIGVLFYEKKDLWIVNIEALNVHENCGKAK